MYIRTNIIEQKLIPILPCTVCFIQENVKRKYAYWGDFYTKGQRLPVGKEVKDYVVSDRGIECEYKKKVPQKSMAHFFLYTGFFVQPP